MSERLHGQATEKPGFFALEDQADIGFVVGATAQVWEPEIPFYVVTPEIPKDFNQPGWARVA